MGPYADLLLGDKSFFSDDGGRAKCIAVDRIKPTFFDPFLPATLAKLPQYGRLSAKESHPSRSHPSAWQIPTVNRPQTHAAPPGISRLSYLLTFRLRLQVARFDFPCDTSDSHFVSFWKGGTLCRV